MVIPLIQHGFVHMVNSKDILFIESEGHRIFVHTPKGIYRPIQTLSDFYDLLYPQFERADKSAIVQMDNICGYDPAQRIIYFVGSRKTCFVSRRHAKQFERFRTDRAAPSVDPP